ncbi:MAG TPA: tetratricopeptide repeat protein [Thermodesulfovibrionales bacterium]|nr:tetratricopeptide repeat protein [Thermodesulfovibrionales bacterium]
MSKPSRKKREVPQSTLARNDISSETSLLSVDRQWSGEGPAPKTRTSQYFLAGMVSVITFLVYLPSLQNEFLVWDDVYYVTDNPMIRSMNLDLIRSAFLKFHASNWHPLTWISHALDYAIWGLNPVGHHLTNVILHAFNTAMVVMVATRLLALYRPTVRKDAVPWLRERGILITGCITGLLFGLHPVHVESVAWVAERKDLLCALFFLMSIFAYLKYVSGNGHTPTNDTARAVRFGGFYFLSLGCFALALLSKPMAVSLPFVLLIIDWYPSNRIHSMRSFLAVFIEKLPFILLSLASSVLTVSAQKDAMEIMTTVPIQSRVLVAAHSLLAYLLNMFLPLNLSPFYAYPDRISLLSLKYFSSVIFVIGISAFGILTARKNRILFSAWCYYVITLMPVLGIIQVGSQSMADRYTYLPSIGPFLLIGLLAARVAAKSAVSKKGTFSAGVMGFAACVVFITIGYLAVGQMRLWENDFTLWSHAIAKGGSEKVDFVYRNRAQAFSYRRQFAMAVTDYTAAINLNPRSYEAFLNRGMAYSEMGHFDRAIADFDEAIALHPRYYEAYNNKGMVYGKVASFDRAIEQFSKAIEINSNQPRPYANRGLAYYLIGENDQALKDFDKAIDLDRNYAEAYGSRGNMFLQTGNRELALSDFQKACDLGDKEGCRVLQTLMRR